MRLLLLENCEVRFSDPDAGATQTLEIPQLEVYAGSLVFVVGRSGQGKTTLLRSIAGLQPIVSGKIETGEEDLKMGMLHQQPQLIPWRTVTGNLALPAELGRPYHTDEEINLMLTALDLRTVESKLPHQLSVGMRTRIALIQVVLAYPKLLLLDEPTASLDDHSSQLVMKYVKTYVEEHNAAAVIVTHDKDLVGQWASSVYRLDGDDVVTVSPQINFAPEE